MVAGGSVVDPRTVIVTLSVASKPSGSVTVSVRLIGSDVFGVASAVQVVVSAVWIREVIRG